MASLECLERTSGRHCDMEPIEDYLDRTVEYHEQLEGGGWLD